MRSLLVLVVLLVVGLVPAINAQCGSQCDTVNAWRNTLFDGLTHISKRGYWVRLITFKETAQVVMVGNTIEEGLIAFATLGNGRVAVFGQDRHVEKFGISEPDSTIQTLHANLLTWLQNGAAGTWKIGMPSSSSELSAFLGDSDYKTIVSHGGLWATDADDDQLKTWVEQGGTLVVGFDKNEFEQATEESAKNINFYSVVLEAGIAFEMKNAAQLGNPIPTAISDISALVELNLHNVANSLTWENFEDNARLNYILQRVMNYPRTYPHEVSRHILSVFEPFAYAMEENMVWPSAIPPNDGPKESITDREHAMYDIYYTLSLAHLWRDKAPNVDKFPGDVTDPPPTETVSFSFQSRNYRHFFTTGYYFVAGQEMTITVNNAPGDNTWLEFKMYCGIYTDELKHRDDIARFPRVAWKRNLVDRETTFKWPFGGLIYFWAPDGLGNSLDVTISGVIPSPYLDIVNDQDFDATWASRCQTKGLSADIRGDYARFTLAADGGVCDMSGQQVKDVVEKWDKIVRKTEELHGASVSAPPEEFTQQSFTSDIQTSFGTLHSGFPIGAVVRYGYASSDVFYLNSIWENMWGPFHELGHNYDKKWWIPAGSVEVTCNIASYFNMERMTTQTWDNVTKIQETISGSKFSSWLASPSWESVHNNIWNRYLVYTQTIRDFGWSCQRDVLKSYLDDQAQGESMPTANNEIMQQWVIRWSQTVGYNLCPLFGNFWKWPLDQSTLDTLASLSPYLPDDPVTQHADAAALTQSVVDAWPNLVRTVDTSSLTCNFFDIEPYV